MEVQFKLVRRACLCVLVMAGLSSAALADGPPERTHVGRDVSVGPGEVVSEVTCFGCNVRIRGHVAGDVTTFGGSVIVEDTGAINGDTTAFGGNVSLETTGKIGGDLTVFGGRIHRDAESVVGGAVTNFSGGFWLPLIVGLPLILLAGFVALIVWLVRRLMRPSVPATA